MSKNRKAKKSRVYNPWDEILENNNKEEIVETISIEEEIKINQRLKKKELEIQAQEARAEIISESLIIGGIYTSPED